MKLIFILSNLQFFAAFEGSACADVLSQFKEGFNTK
jgi:hypothetical protein